MHASESRPHFVTPRWALAQRRRAKFCSGCANCTRARYPSPFPSPFQQSTCHSPRSLPQCNALKTKAPQSIPPVRLPFAALVTSVQCAEDERAHTASSVHEPESPNRPCASKHGRWHRASVRLCVVAAIGNLWPQKLTSAQCAEDGRPRTVSSVHEPESRYRRGASKPMRQQQSIKLGMQLFVVWFLLLVFGSTFWTGEKVDFKWSLKLRFSLISPQSASRSCLWSLLEECQVTGPKCSSKMIFSNLCTFATQK